MNLDKTRPKLAGNIIFVFSDPGGAKPCLSLIDENNLVNAIAISDRQYFFYKDFKTPVKILKKDFEDLIEDIQPDIIFTGTSYKSDIEQQFIKIALRKSISCYSFVDHWTSISKRFEDPFGEKTFPNQVWVIDERAKILAIREGIDENKIVISGNPYHEWLKKWIPVISKDDFLKQIQLKYKNKKLLLYAPDPLSNVNGKEKYGFDELSATMEMVGLFVKHKTELKDWIVLVKSHPNQNREKLIKLISDNSSFAFMSEDVDTNTAIYYADVVMGFFSSLLIEASIMNKSVLRFLENEGEDDPISELNIGTIVNKNSFIKTLSKFSL